MDGCKSTIITFYGGGVATRAELCSSVSSHEKNTPFCPISSYRTGSASAFVPCYVLYFLQEVSQKGRNSSILFIRLTDIVLSISAAECYRQIIEVIVPLTQKDKEVDLLPNTIQR